MQRTRKSVLLLSGVLGFVATTCYAWVLYEKNIPQNIASWLMVLALEVIGLLSVMKDGNKKPYLQVGWTAAALFVVTAIAFGDSQWQWGWTETVSLLFCVAATSLYLAVSARTAIWAYMGAMYVAFVPLMVDYWHTPQPETLWFWLLNILACSLAVYGAQKRDFANVFIPWASILQNGVIAALCIL